jgi:dCMP deaminase
MNKTERSRPSWDEYGMMLAYTASSRSPDPYVTVGAAAFREDRSTVSTGYNGAVSGVEIDWSDRDFRRRFVVHAERNCLKYAKVGEPYYLYVTLSPCLECLGIAKTYGVREIIYDQIYERDSSALTKASEYGISIRQLSLKDEYLKPKSNIV